MRWMFCSGVLLLSFLYSSQSFVVLPYIQIDFAHYVRLAQCAAKCTEKYANSTKRFLNDGSVEEYFDSTANDVKLCELGCQHRHKNRVRSSSAQVHDGMEFWQTSTSESDAVGTSPISSVELLCQDAKKSDEFEDTMAGTVALFTSRSAGPVRYVIQWKQRSFSLGYYDESHWITASIEAGSTFTVDGLIPGVQYRFMATAIGPAGRLGESVTSEWFETGTPTAHAQPAGPLVAKNGYNTEDGVSVKLTWSPSQFDTCDFKLQLTNLTHQFTKEYTMDKSRSVVLSHLEFDSLYTVTLTTLDDIPAQEAKPLTTQFKSFNCRQVYGRSSLNCAPDAVENLKVVVSSNGSSTVSWKPSTDDISTILTYQLSFSATNTGPRCPHNVQSLYTKSNVQKVSLDLPSGCEYIIEVTVYDLLGRDATARTRIVVPDTYASQLLRIDVFLIIGAVAMMLLLCLSLHCCLSCRSNQRKKEVNKTTSSYV